MDVNAAPTPYQVDVNGTPVIVAPQGWQMNILSQLSPIAHAQKPAIVRGKQIVRDNASFAYYDDRFSTPSTLYTVSRVHRRVTAQLDYHQDAATPGHEQHILMREFKLSKQFAAWSGKNKEVFSQIDFANFLEDRIGDVSPHGEVSQADLLSAVVQFKANQNSTCASATNLTNGDVEFQFTSNTQVISSHFPTQLTLRLPMFEFGQVLDINARLKFRLKEGVLVFWFELIRIDEVTDALFDLEVQALRQQLGEGNKTFILED